jgi:MFS family permease
MRGVLTRSFAPVLASFRNPAVRRLQLAFAGSLLGSWSYLVALGVYAYGKGGARDVALVGLLRMVPAGFASPFMAAFVDRFSRRVVLVASDVVRASAMGAAAAVIATGGSRWIVYSLVAVAGVAGSVFHPAMNALLPALVRSPAELTAANVATSTLDGIATFSGPAIGGIVLAATNAETVFALNGASFVWSALLVIGIRVNEAVDERRREGEQRGNMFTAGFRAILQRPGVRLLVALYAGQTIVAGAMSVFVVVTGLELLHRGATTVGLLSAALGAGGLIGGFIAMALSSRSNLTTDFAVGLALFGAPFALIGGVPELVPAFLAMGIVGIGNSIVDVSAVTLLQRAVPDDVLGRVLGVVYGMLLGTFGLGALLTPLLIDAFSARTALIIVGAFLPAIALLTAPALRRLEAAAPAPAFVDLVRGVPILSALPLPTLERLASALAEVRMPAGATVIREGEPGDRFYIVSEGEVEIAGQTFGPGSGFGEIALLRDVPRTATVTAKTDVVLQALERDDFLDAVTGHEPSVAAADAVIAGRLGERRTDLTTEAGAA